MTKPSEEKIRTLHPEGKNGVNMTKVKYDLLFEAVHAVIINKGPLTFTELLSEVEKYVGKTFTGNVGWYLISVKLDMEARKLLRRKKDGKRELLELV